MPSVRLPALPKGKELEEYISAFFQSAPYYIERNIIERDIEEVLELDIIVTDYQLSPPDIKLVEVKSGSCGFPDIFKLRGWLDYLNLSHAILITTKQFNNLAFFEKKAKALDIDFLAIPSLKAVAAALSDFITAENIPPVDISTWRFSYWVERNLLKRLNKKKKAHPTQKRYKALEHYYFEVNSEIFFTQYIIEKIDKLYSAFQQYPRISAKCGHEIVGSSFDLEYEALPTQVFEDTYYKCKYNDIQISTFVEHRARLAILKNAIDYKLCEKAGLKGGTGSRSKIVGQERSLMDLLPYSFQQGLESISEHQYYHRYPIFWQWFMWLFGGMILKDYKEKEYEILSLKTGIPAGEIPNAFQAYQVLFPLEGGWFVDLSPNSSIEIMKMFPVPFMGIGADYRVSIYTASRKYEDLSLTGEHTLRDLIKWHNLTVDVLAT